MNPRSWRYLKLMTVAGLLWALYLVPWPGLPWLEPVKPTIIAAAFAMLSWRVGVGSWPLTIVFSLTFFVHGVVSAYLNNVSLNGDASPAATAMGLYFWAVALSPISLWGPVLFGALSYAMCLGAVATRKPS